MIDQMTLSELRAYAVRIGLSSVTRIRQGGKLLAAIRYMQAKYPSRYGETT